MLPEAETWLRYANEDLATARVTLAGGRWAATSLHAQQAAEKALKALWLERRKLPPPRTHDLVRLAGDLSLPSEWVPEIDALSRVYLASRYPAALGDDDPPYGIDEAGAKEHLALAERIFRWTEQRLSTA